MKVMKRIFTHRMVKKQFENKYCNKVPPTPNNLTNGQKWEFDKQMESRNGQRTEDVA